MGGAAAKWRPGRGRRAGWGALAGGASGGAGCGRGAGGSGGPGGGRTAAAGGAPPSAPGLGLWPNRPDASCSSRRLCCSSSWRRRCRRRCSCCHSARPGPRRRQLRTHPGPLLHPHGGVARPRRAGRAGGRRRHKSQAREGRSLPPRRRPPAAGSALTLMLRGAPVPGGVSLPAPSPSHRGSWRGRPRPTSRLCVVASSPLLRPARHKSGQRPAGRCPSSESKPPREPAARRSALLGRAGPGYSERRPGSSASALRMPPL